MQSTSHLTSCYAIFKVLSGLSPSSLALVNKIAEKVYPIEFKALGLLPLAMSHSHTFLV
ncbi:hypothetical protein [Scytonema sp. PRP1]|uniref:hypothetical protein n=1 Tax=Scytonema sp. PRP1 TaxID=3120513 RepID=UPI00300C8A12